MKLSGLGRSFDLAVCQSDQKMAAAIQRNLLGARGAMGVEHHEGDLKEIGRADRKYRRVVNLVGGAKAINVNELELKKESMPDDGNGVHDFTPDEVDKCLMYPEVMLGLTDKYLRYQLARLKKVSDDKIMSGTWEKLKLGRSKS
ncbi:hypothetical protein BKA70DRAFT_1539629 [Coprinopsis sp. MPI-PUGE-AT-0042]|nr:hypothetical protein BKA70DRAFT_1539629 [Coprinopsis sp. MPI-PUGE-AT-0042]